MIFFSTMTYPCPNCVFLKTGAKQLRPGHLESVCRDLLKDDCARCICHAEVKSECAGATIYRLKAGRPPVWFRAFAAMGLVRYDEKMAWAENIIDPPSSVAIPAVAADAKNTKRKSPKRKEAP